MRTSRFEREDNSMSVASNKNAFNGTTSRKAWLFGAIAAAAIIMAPLSDAEAGRRGRNAALIIGGIAAVGLIAGLAASNAQNKPGKRCVRKRVWVEDEFGDPHRVWRRVCS
jgi:uncharacterized membrane protein YebE (DUF533 family)